MCENTIRQYQQIDGTTDSAAIAYCYRAAVRNNAVKYGKRCETSQEGKQILQSCRWSLGTSLFLSYIHEKVRESGPRPIIQSLYQRISLSSASTLSLRITETPWQCGSHHSCLFSYYVVSINIAAFRPYMELPTHAVQITTVCIRVRACILLLYPSDSLLSHKLRLAMSHWMLSLHNYSLSPSLSVSH